MNARLLDGKATAADVRRELTERAAGPTATNSLPPSLGTVLGVDAPLPCTPRGIVELLRRHEVPLAGARVCVIARGVTVGRPIGLLPTRRSENAAVTSRHTGAKGLARHVREADVVIAAAGSPGLVTKDMPRPGAVVLDVGITRTGEGPAGGIHPEAAQAADWIAPMPGGVGPMTRATLPANVVEAAERNATVV
ncbi:Bifunctional protein FolD protein [Streptomyces sp. enrichment culture]|uniref:hypothetical protein n=1 Tax=Streptomyces sp. enrichment culture TaxID=1795815 RepID=UPI003F549519